MKQLTILVDMDDTIELLAKAWVSYLNRKYRINVRYEDLDSWNMEQAFPMLSKEQVYQVLHEESLWEEVYPMDGAISGLQKLMEDGHQIYIVTATNVDTVRSKMYNVLFKYFPFILWDHVIITSNKQMIRGDVMVDDAPHNLEGGHYHKILMDAFHNRNYDAERNGMIRVHTWEEVCTTIHKIAQEET